MSYIRGWGVSRVSVHSWALWPAAATVLRTPLLQVGSRLVFLSLSIFADHETSKNWSYIVKHCSGSVNVSFLHLYSELYHAFCAVESLGVASFCRHRRNYFHFHACIKLFSHPCSPVSSADTHTEPANNKRGSLAFAMVSTFLAVDIKIAYISCSAYLRIYLFFTM